MRIYIKRITDGAVLVDGEIVYDLLGQSREEQISDWKRRLIGTHPLAKGLTEEDLAATLIDD